MRKLFFYRQIENSTVANQIHGFTIDYGKFILITINSHRGREGELRTAVMKLNLRMSPPIRVSSIIYRSPICESVNLIGYIIVFYLLIVNSYASVHIARHV